VISYSLSLSNSFVCCLESLPRGRYMLFNNFVECRKGFAMSLKMFKAEAIF
jgi:hypothetical protein